MRCDERKPLGTTKRAPPTEGTPQTWGCCCVVVDWRGVSVQAMSGQSPTEKSRRYPRHFLVNPWQVYRTGIFFVTLCTHRRKPILAVPAVHALFDDAIRKATRWRVSRYLIMPDHIHMFCHPYGSEKNSFGRSEDVPNLSRWIQYIKSQVSLRWPCPDQQPIWQRDFWDTELRNARHFQSRWNYVRGNPVRKGLVREPEEWPYIGGEISPESSAQG